MLVILSNTPPFVVKRLASKYPIRRWVYFGKRHSVAVKMGAALGPQAEAVEYARELYFLSEEKRRPFIEWIDQISLAGKKQKEWLYSVPAVKNTYTTSNLFLYICYYFLLDQWIKKGEKIDLVVVDSPALGFIFRKNFFSRVKFPTFNYFRAATFYFYVFLVSGFKYLRFFWEAAKKYAAAKFILRGRIHPLLEDKKEIVIIRNFIGSDFSSQEPGSFENHFFPGLSHYLKENGNYPSVFFPILVNAASYRKLFVQIAESNQRILLAEEFLKPSDYFTTLFSWVRALSYKFFPPLWEGVQFGGLLKEEYYSNLTEEGFLRADLISMLGRRLKNSGITPVGIINWNENQAVEKGLMIGLKQYFKEMTILASRPFVYPLNQLSVTPSQQDRLFGLVPDKTLVLGPIGRQTVREYLQDLPTEYSPAFRYKKLLSRSLKPTTREDNVMILFGYSLPNSVSTLRILLGIDDTLKLFGQVYLRLHPTTHFNKHRLVKELGRSLPSHYSFADGLLEDHLDHISIGICGSTGTALNLVVSGIPVIIMADPNNDLTMNYLSYTEDPSMWRLCFSQTEIVEALKEFRGLILQEPHRLDEKAMEFRKAYFVEPDSQHWKNYLL